MSVAKRIAEAIDKLVAHDYEGSLIPTSIAVAATAETTYPPTWKDNRKYKQFLRDYGPLVTFVATGGMIVTQRTLGIHVGYQHPKIKQDPHGGVSLEDVLYKVVRCGLVHNASLPSDLQFVDGIVFSPASDKGDPMLLPAHLIDGLILAVVCAPANSSESLAIDRTFNLCGNLFGKQVPLNNYWGRRRALAKYLGMTSWP